MAGNYPITKNYLTTYGNQVEQEIETRLRNNDKYSSGDLYDSIRYEIKENSVKFTISFYMLDYGRFVDKGVKGAESGKAGEGGTSPYAFRSKMPPPKAIEKWMKIKGIPAEASYPIRRTIFRLGITPTNFFSIPTTRRKKQLEEGVRNSMIKDVEANIKKQYGKKR